MIERLPDLPDHVLRFSAIGQVTAEDYESVIIPAVEQALTRHPKIRLLYHLGGGFEGFDVGAMWDDAKVGLQHPSAWERIAVVTDVEWLRVATRVFGFALPGHVRVFDDRALAEARAWLVE